MKLPKLTLTKSLTAFTLLTTLIPLTSVKAESLFGQQEVNQSDFIAIASPNNLGYGLVILEQIPGGRSCWSENGSNPVFINPLLLTYDDFSKDCHRATDSNGYSIVIDGQENNRYSLRVEERNQELVLIAKHLRDNSEVVIGRTKGLSATGEDFLKIFLDPGWKFTKRTFEGEVLGHIYLTGNDITIANSSNQLVVSSNPSTSCNNDIIIHSTSQPFNQGTSWRNCNGYTLAFQNDGNLVLYSPVGNAIWSTNTTRREANRFAVQPDGNLVLYNGQTPVWDSKTVGYPNSYLAIQSDGNVVLYDSQSRAYWSTDTYER